MEDDISVSVVLQHEAPPASDSSDKNFNQLLAKIRNPVHSKTTVEAMAMASKLALKKNKAQITRQITNSDSVPSREKSDSKAV